ncbi:Protein kinase domain - like 10 [Theobroma cacao]|nr:Protein kinase domain - like 10 [Theobroma cacao]
MEETQSTLYTWRAPHCRQHFDIARRVYDFSSGDLPFSVYRGYINDSYKDLVSIKVSEPTSDHQNFLTEIELLSNLRQANIVSLISYCCDGSDKIIVHEYTPHGTLYDHLLNPNNGNPPDIKSKIILVNKNLVAKLSNFGFYKLISTSLSETDNHVTTAGADNSVGYEDPDYVYLQNNGLTVKSDVYCFGAVLFQVLCAKPVFELCESRVEVQNISNSSARRCVEDGTLGQIIDPCLKGEIAANSLKAYVDVACNCLNDREDERPTLADVAKRLELTLLLQECIEADIPFSPSWLRSIPWPVEESESRAESQDFIILCL